MNRCLLPQSRLNLSSISRLADLDQLLAYPQPLDLSENSALTFDLHQNISECSQSYLNTLPQGGLRHLFEAIPSEIESADYNHDHFVTSKELRFYWEHERSQHLEGKQLNFTLYARLAQLRLNLVPAYVETSSRSLSDTKGVLLNFIHEWENFAQENPDELRRVGIDPANWRNQITLYGLSLQDQEVQNLFQKMETGPETLNPTQIAALNLLANSLNSDQLWRGPLTPENYVQLFDVLSHFERGSLLARWLSNNENTLFANLPVLRQNSSSARQNSWTQNEVLALAFPKTPSRAGLNLLYSFFERNTVDQITERFFKREMHQLYTMFFGWQNCLFMSCTLLYDRFLQEGLFRFLGKNLLQHSTLETRLHWNQYRQQLQWNRRILLQTSPKRYVAAQLFNFFCTPLLVFNLEHSLFPHLNQNNEQNPSLQHVLFETSFNLLIGLPLFEWIPNFLHRGGVLQQISKLALQQARAQRNLNVLASLTRIPKVASLGIGAYLLYKFCSDL